MTKKHGCVFGLIVFCLGLVSRVHASGDEMLELPFGSAEVRVTIVTPPLPLSPVSPPGGTVTVVSRGVTPELPPNSVTVLPDAHPPLSLGLAGLPYRNPQDVAEYLLLAFEGGESRPLRLSPWITDIHQQPLRLVLGVKVGDLKVSLMPGPGANTSGLLNARGELSVTLDQYLGGSASFSPILPLIIRFSQQIWANAESYRLSREALSLLQGPYSLGHVILSGIRTDNLHSFFFTPQGNAGSTRGHQYRFPGMQRLEIQQLEWLATEMSTNTLSSNMLEVLERWSDLEVLVIQFSLWQQNPQAVPHAASDGRSHPMWDSSMNFIYVFYAGLQKLYNDNRVRQSNLQMLQFVLPSAGGGISIDEHDKLLTIFANFLSLSKLKYLRVFVGENLVANIEPTRPSSK